jgi:CDP-diacylglycerol--glycerol-3-phosphate 3-phosphatidyltransferase
VVVGLVIVAACVSEMAGRARPDGGRARRFDGPMGKSDRALVFGALGLYLGLGYALPDVAFWLMPALALLIGCNVVLRVLRGAAAATKGAR